jgi:amino acid transporter
MESEPLITSGLGKPLAIDKHWLNVWSVAAVGIGSMVGAGIFALLGQVDSVAGHMTYVVSGTLSLMYLLTLAVTIALVAKSFGAYATRLFLDGGASHVWTSVFASGIVILLTLINISGSGAVGKAEILLVATKLIILVVLMVSGASVLDLNRVQDHFHPGWIGVIGSVGLVFFAYAGYGMMANAAGEVAHPEKTIPRAIFLAIGVVIVLYCGLSLIVLSALSPAQLLKHAETAP